MMWVSKRATKIRPNIVRTQSGEVVKINSKARLDKKGGMFLSGKAILSSSKFKQDLDELSEYVRHERTKKVAG